MADSSISILTSDDNPIQHSINGMPAISSKEMAFHFQRKHKNILRDIEKTLSIVPDDFHKLNFEPMIIEVETGKGAVRKDKAYLLSRDAFSLIAMGFTGTVAIRWKLKYIEAFNALEQQVLHAHVKQARLEAVNSTLTLTPKKKEDIKKVIAYRKRGFSYTEIGKVMAIHKRTVGNLLRTARAIGMEV